MSITKVSKEYHEEIFPGYHSRFLGTDYEFIERFDNFAFDEVVNHDGLDRETRFLAILTTLLGCQGIDEFRAMIPAALNFGVTPVKIKEVVYQAMVYLGIGRIFPFLKATNEVSVTQGVELLPPGQAAATTENRLEADEKARIDIMGEGMKNFQKSGPEKNRHTNTWLTDSRFGDYCTRTGLTCQQWEMITFCLLSAQDSCEPQFISHTGASMGIGSDKVFLIRIISQCILYLDYPRSLNALCYVNETAKGT